ncbi:MAG: HAD family hydrolase [Patescibacteria group bacterium]
MKPILFIDFDGTLCHDRFWRSLPKEEYEKTRELLFSDDKTYVREWMKGKHTAEEVNEKLAEHLGIPFEVLWNVFVQDAKTMRVSKEVLEAIGRLRSRYTTVLLTVNMDSFSRFTVPALGLDGYFDAISNSYYEGKFKVDNGGEIFREYLDRFSAPLATSVLIDDSLDACETFRSLGGIAHPVTPEKDLAYYVQKL